LRSRPKDSKDGLLETPNEVAAELARLGPWGKFPGRRKKSDGPPIPRPDNHRVHVTSEKLVDDIVEYMGDSLLRHKGCDVIDIFPGSGVWSKKLNEVLQPRSHILMEPEADILYRPFLEPMLDRPGVQLVPYSGVMWDQLGKVLSPQYLPHQVAQPLLVPPSVPLERNDTLLVTANLSFYPKKIFQFQDNMAQMVLFQFIQSIRSSTLFNKYGLVRMLIWIHADEIPGKLPRCMQNRRRATVEMELNTEYMHEIAGGDYDEGTIWLRNHNLDLEGGRKVLARMRDKGIRVPAGRETKLYRELHSDPAKVEEGPAYRLPLFLEALALEKKYLQGLIPTGSDEYKLYRRRINYYSTRRRRFEQLHLYVKRLEALEAMYHAGQHDEANRLFGILTQEIQSQTTGIQADFFLLRDNIRAFKNDVLCWDRREFEPLQVQPLEFFPNVQCSLVDIQPKSPHQLLREVGKRSCRSGDYWDLLLRRMYSNPNNTITQSMDQVYAGAADGILPECASLHDPTVGGSPFSGFGECTVRSLTEQQFLEVLEKWIEWPFRPSFYRFLGASEEPADLDQHNMWVD